MKFKSWLKHPILCFDAIQRRKLPTINLDDTSQNCKVCGYDHQFKTKYNKKHYCEYEV